MVLRHEASRWGRCPYGAGAQREATAANVADVTEAHALLHGEEREIFADASYQGAHQREENRAHPGCWHIAMKRGARRQLGDTPEEQLAEQWERLKAKVRAKVEHSFHVVEQLFGRCATEG